MKRENKLKLKCEKCNTVVPCYYTGPLGHAPQDICYDCWLEARLTRSPLFQNAQARALQSLANGRTKKEASIAAGISPRTLRRWLKRLRESPQKLQEALKAV